MVKLVIIIPYFIMIIFNIFVGPSSIMNLDIRMIGHNKLGIYCINMLGKMVQELGPGLLCRHNFEHNKSLKTLSIMLA